MRKEAAAKMFLFVVVSPVKVNNLMCVKSVVDAEAVGGREAVFNEEAGLT